MPPSIGAVAATAARSSFTSTWSGSGLAGLDSGVTLEAVMSHSCGRAAGWQADGAGPAGGDQLDQLLLVDLLAVHDGRHPAEVEHRDAVGDLQHVVHVVADQHHGDALVG